MTSAASLLSTTQLSQDSSTYERGKTPDRKVGLPVAATGVGMVAVHKTVEFGVGGADELASSPNGSPDGALTINHDSGEATMDDSALPIDREDLRHQMSLDARAAVASVYAEMPNTQV